MIWSKRWEFHHQVWSERIYHEEVSLKACLVKTVVQMMELWGTCPDTWIFEGCLELNCDWEC